MPPVLDVALFVLARGMQQDSAAHLFRLRIQKGKTVLQLIPKAIRSSALVKRRPAVDSAADGLILQPSVHHNVDAVVRRFYPDSSQLSAPFRFDSFQLRKAGVVIRYALKGRLCFCQQKDKPACIAFFYFINASLLCGRKRTMLVNGIDRIRSRYLPGSCSCAVRESTDTLTGFPYGTNTVSSHRRPERVPVKTEYPKPWRAVQPSNGEKPAASPRSRISYRSSGRDRTPGHNTTV